MPLAERMTLGVRFSLMAWDSACDTASSNPGKKMGLTPERISACMSSSKKEVSHWRKMLVASMARGLST